MLWILPLALMAQSTTDGNSDPWFPFGKSATFVAYINPSTTRVQADGSRAIWLQYVLNKPRKDGTIRMLIRTEFNCQNETSSTLALTWYDAIGNVTYQHTVTPYERTVQAITPESILNSALDLVCKKAT